MDKLSELSKPVAYKFDHGVMGPGDFKYGTPQMHSTAKDENASPLYSQEYVSALLAELEASKKSNAFLKEQLAKLANFNPDWDMLEACRESWREVAAALKEAEAKLEAKDKCIAEAEVRGVEKLAAAFKSWASDETFPDCEAQRHWATASQEALSFAGDLRHGSCDDR
ncbi:hypothetical protein [Serratia sp. S119]|uniref:hypothetical protein n=1 Tax=Serratia sp. S119 TaxID=1118230 RepID=UPI00097BEBC2|nr:hypothetical protein [Serratia sp. S119]ONK18427.1 hypothetical protein BHT35_2744 [Serratia sp. S119]